MGIQQGLCSISPSYLLAAWKNDPAHPVAGNHFPPGIEDQISVARLYYPAPFNWVDLGTLPGNTSIGPALTCDQNDVSPGPGPSVYAVWKGEENDTRLFSSRLTLPFNLLGLPSDPESQTWQPQAQIRGADSTWSPSIAFVGNVGDGLPAFIFTVWSGLGNGEPGNLGDNTLWYSITPVPADPGYVNSLSAPDPSNQIPGAASAGGAAVTLDLDGNLFVVWFDLLFNQWLYTIGTVVGTAITWASPGVLPDLPNDAGYSLGSAFLGNQGDPNGIYFAWSDVSDQLWITGAQNLIDGLLVPPTPIPSAIDQATSSYGCALASLFQQDPVNSENLVTVLYAMWADTSGQLHYASTTDGINWQDYGNLAYATTAPDIPFNRGHGRPRRQQDSSAFA